MQGWSFFEHKNDQKKIQHFKTHQQMNNVNALKKS